MKKELIFFFLTKHHFCLVIVPVCMCFIMMHIVVYPTTNVKE